MRSRFRKAISVSQRIHNADDPGDTNITEVRPVVRPVVRPPVLGIARETANDEGRTERVHAQEKTQGTRDPSQKPQMEKYLHSTTKQGDQKWANVQHTHTWWK